MAIHWEELQIDYERIEEGLRNDHTGNGIQETCSEIRDALVGDSPAVMKQCLGE